MKENSIGEDMLYKKRSSIHGMGLYTSKPIKSGSIIGIFKIVPATYDSKFTIWVDEVRYRATNILKYANHSTRPNVSVSNDVNPMECVMIAIKDIKENEEIVWNYGKEFTKAQKELNK